MKNIFAVLAFAPIAAFATTTTFDTARVDFVTPQVEQVRVPGQCRMVTSTEQRQTAGGNRTGGSILGGVVGGLLGSQVGGGNGKVAATAAGAIAGVLVGGNVAAGSGTGYEPVQTSNQVCDQDSFSTRTTGYLVEYTYRGERNSVVMQNDPGRHIQMRVTAEPVIK